MRPLIEAGWMPNLQELMSGGKSGTLLSTIPYITCPAWLSMASGKNPGWMGVFGFMNLEPASYDVRYYNYHKDPAIPEIWDILGDQDISCGVINNPIVRNPRPVNGYMVPGFLADDRSFETYPESLRSFLDDAAGEYELEARGFSVMEPEKVVKECGRVMHKRYAAFNALLKEHPTRFWLGVFHLTDRVCHVALNLTGLPLRPDEDSLNASTASFFGQLDQHFGALVGEYVGEEDLLIILSDHGFAPCSKGLLLNSWLVKEGYLKLKPLRGMSRLGVNQRRIAVALDKMGLLKTAMKVTPRFLRRLVPEGLARGDHLSVVDLIQSEGVDWKSSLAVALPNHGIYINSADRPEGRVAAGGERDSLIQELQRKLLDFQDDMTGEKPVVSVSPGEELYSGPLADRAPDLLVETEEGWTTKAVIDVQGRLSMDLTQADHRREGMFLISGPGVGSGEVEEAHIEDIAPTVLEFMGFNSPSPMDGDSLL
jgi:predicted AlkP superfamily phosphohydrolase/phosphomutase